MKKFKCSYEKVGLCEMGVGLQSVTSLADLPKRKFDFARGLLNPERS